MAAPSSRLTQMSIDLGDEQVAIERIESIESLSTPFLISLDILAPLEIDIAPHLGKPARVKVMDDNQPLRHFHGFVTSAEYCKESASGHHYRLTLRPWTYFLDQNRDFAIYQEKNVVDIIKLVLEEAGISDIDYAKLSKARTKRNYCVQYGESDFAFISRLMEEEGIYYHFVHSNERHTMILCESPNAHSAGTPASLYYSPSSESILSTDAVGRTGARLFYLQEWTERVSTTAGAKVTMRDWDFEKPDKPLNNPAVGEGKHPQDAQELYTYPGRYVQEAHGTDMGKVVLEANRAERRVFSGFSHAVGLEVGNRVAVTNHPVPRMNATYVIISAQHSIASENYRAGRAETEPMFDVRFEAIPCETQYHAVQRTPRPVVQGLESAVITGPKDETIYTDEYGRVKVRFHWDRHGLDGDKTTCWIRVSQTGGLGNLILPRVGHEVLVDFLSGNPDRPVVVGRVFNRAHMPIYALPANKTRVLWRTKTYGDGGAYPDTKALTEARKSVNEIRFEDKGGKEEIFIHAERDLRTYIHFDEDHEVGHIQNEMVGFDRKAFVGRDETTIIGRHQTDTIGKDQTSNVGNDQVDTVGNNRSTSVGTSDSLTIGSNRSLTAGRKITYSAGTSIELKVGGSSIMIDNMGITIKAPMISVEGQMSAEMKALKTSVTGTLVVVQGGLVKIN